MELKGKTALVTGAARRVGRVIALTLAGRGARVIITYNQSGAEVATVVREIEAAGVEGLALRADLANSSQVRAMAEQAVAAFGGVDLLVNNAAVYFRTPFDRLTEADWDRTLIPNLKGPFLTSLTLGRHMRARGAGVIVNIADWAGERPYRDYLPYCVSKAGVIALTRGLALELAPAVRVNCVCPGPVLLPEDLGADEVAGVIAGTPLGRVGTPEDIARAVAFLAESGDFITGAALMVDGGRLIGP